MDRPDASPPKTPPLPSFGDRLPQESPGSKIASTGAASLVNRRLPVAGFLHKLVGVSSAFALFAPHDLLHVQEAGQSVSDT